MSIRKTLKSSKTITKGFVSYPAKLVVMYAGENTYKVHRDFSKLKVAYDPIDKIHKVVKSPEAVTPAVVANDRS